jgi:hypothetical protein
MVSYTLKFLWWTFFSRKIAGDEPWAMVSDFE